MISQHPATPTTAAGLRRYDDLPAAEAVLRAWREPGPMRDWHAAVQREIRRIAPVLGRALDRLTREGPDRAAAAQRAVESVAGSLLALYGRCESDGAGGADLVDELTEAERWRRATVIVDELLRAGLI